MKDINPILAGSEYANELGFTKDKFDGYLWDSGNGAITISFVVSLSPGGGHFSEFVRGLIDMGKKVKVPNPLGRMILILEHLGFRHTLEFDELLQESVNIWIKEARK